MIAYIDPSLLARTYLDDEDGHEAAIALVGGDEHDLCTGTWTPIEVVGALVRAERAGRIEATTMIDAALWDLSAAGPVAVVAAPQDEVERRAFTIARTHGLRAGDCWHLAVAQLALPLLAFEGDPFGLATRDARQAEVAADLGFELL